MRRALPTQESIRANMTPMIDVVFLLIQIGEIVEHVAAKRSVDALGIGEKEHGIARVSKLYTLVLVGEEACSPEPIIKRLVIGTTRAA